MRESIAESEEAVFSDFCNSFCLEGKRVLEIGGALPLDLALKCGCMEWVAIDPRNKNVKVNNIYQTIEGYAQLIPYPDNYFDYIFSCNCFHHIRSFDMAFNEMYRVLKLDGIVYSNFGPIWTAPDGSHIEDVLYQGKLYHFWENAYIPDWYHLVYNSHELYQILSSRLEAGLAKVLSEYIYMSSWLARTTYQEFQSIVKNSSFREVLFFGGTKEFGYERKHIEYDNPFQDKYEKWMEAHKDSLEEYRNRDLKICVKK